MRALIKGRLWTVFLVGVALRILPERVEGQHRAGDIAVWLSEFPKGS